MKRRAMFFLISQCITLFGSQLVQMAIVWYVTLRTSSGMWVALFSVCSYLPQFFVSFVGGVWADRYNRKRLIIMADAGIAAVTLAMALLMPKISSDNVLLTALLIMSMIRSVGAGIQYPAVNAVIPQLVPEEQLMKYNGLNATMQSVVQFAAPAAAGAILSISTPGAALFIDVATAAAGIGLLSCIAIPKISAECEPSTILSDMKSGIRYAFAHTKVKRTLTMYSLFIFLSVPAGYLAGLYVSRTFGDSYIYLTAVELVGFGGMLVGGLLMSLWGGFKNRNSTMRAGLALFGITAFGMGLTRGFVLYLALMAVYGVALTAVQSTITTLLQQNTDAEMQGRIFGLMGSLYAGCYPVGMAIFGGMADVIPLSVIMLSSGIALVALAMFIPKHE